MQNIFHAYIYWNYTVTLVGIYYLFIVRRVVEGFSEIRFFNWRRDSSETIIRTPLCYRARTRPGEIGSEWS